MKAKPKAKVKLHTDSTQYFQIPGQELNPQTCEVLLPSKVNGLLRLKRITTREDSTRPHPVNNSHKSLQYTGKIKRSAASSTHQTYIHRITWLIKPKTAILKPNVASATSHSHMKRIQVTTACHITAGQTLGCTFQDCARTGCTFPAITTISEIWELQWHVSSLHLYLLFLKYNHIVGTSFCSVEPLLVPECFFLSQQWQTTIKSAPWEPKTII